MDAKRAGRKPVRRTEPRGNSTPARGRKPVTDPLVAAAMKQMIERNGHARVVEITARRALLVAARHLLREHVDRCTKCGSTFVTHEPAFVHCHYCGRMHRVANASLPDQELFEIRRGLRLAS